MTNKSRLGATTAIIILAFTMGGCETVTNQQIGTGLGGIAADWPAASSGLEPAG